MASERRQNVRRIFKGGKVFQKCRFMLICAGCFFIRPSFYSRYFLCSTVTDLKMKFLAKFLLLFSCVVITHQNHHTIYQWSAFEFDYPNAQARNDAIKRGQYIRENVLIMDVDYHGNVSELYCWSINVLCIQFLLLH